MTSEPTTAPGNALLQASVAARTEEIARSSGTSEPDSRHGFDHRAFGLLKEYGPRPKLAEYVPAIPRLAGKPHFVEVVISGDCSARVRSMTFERSSRLFVEPRLLGGR
jgi:hypothetical protein